MWLWTLGCARAPDPAPPGLDDMLADAFRDWEEPILVAQDVERLAEWAADEGREDAAWEGYALQPLAAGDLATAVVPPGADLSALRGVTTTFQSAYPVAEHARLALMPDQTWTDPATFERYDRVVIDGDADAFADGRGSVRTENDIDKSGAFGIHIPYTLRKDYRWTADSRAVLLRWFLLEPGCSDNGKNCVLQSYGVELLVDRPAGAQRVLANWMEVVTEADVLLSEDARIGLIADGNQDLMLATDEYLAGH